MLNHRPKNLNPEEMERYEAIVASMRADGEDEPENKVLQAIGGLIVISLILFADSVLVMLGT